MWMRQRRRERETEREKEEVPNSDGSEMEGEPK